MIAVDTSITVPALADWHEAHDDARSIADEACAPAHVVMETYAVLTRLPSPHRVAPAVAAEVITRWFPGDRVLVPSAELLVQLPHRLSEAQLTGRATYDAVIALTADEAGLELVSRDARATATYEALRVTYRIVSDGTASGAP